MKKLGMFLRVGFIVALIFSMVGSTALALPMYFFDRTAFNAALSSSLHFEGFETAHEGPTVVLTDFTVEETGGRNGIANTLTNPAFGTAPVTEGQGAIFYFNNGNSIATFAFTIAGKINAFGLDITMNTDSSVLIGGDYNLIFGLSANTPQFFGVIDYDTLFDTISFTHFQTPWLTEPVTGFIGFDAVQYGITGDPIPEPSTVLLLGVGLIGLFGVGRKKFKK